RVAIDVGVEDACAVPQADEGSGEVRGERGLADAALAAGHRDHARGRADGDSRRALRDASAQPLGERGLLLRRHDVEAEPDGLHTLDGRERALHLLLEAGPQRTAGDGESDGDVAPPAVDLHVADHVELDDRAPELGVDDAHERLHDFFARNSHEARLPSASNANPTLPSVRMKPWTNAFCSSRTTRRSGRS